MTGGILNLLWTAFWIFFFYRIFGSTMLYYIDQKIHKLEYMTARWGYLYRLMQCKNGTAQARVYYHMMRAKYDEKVILPMEAGIWFWLARILIAIPAGLVMAMMVIITTISCAIFGGPAFRMTPDRFSPVEALLWPRTFIRYCKQIKLNHQEYEKCRDYVKSQISPID